MPSVEKAVNMSFLLLLLQAPQTDDLSRYACADKQFWMRFQENEMGFPFNICDRLWSKNVIKKFLPQIYAALT